MHQVFFACLISLFLVSGTLGGDVSILGPDSLEVREADLFHVEGLTAEQFADCIVSVFPKKDKPQVLVLQTLNNKPVLYIKGRTAGKFAVILDVNIVGKYDLVIHELTIGGGPPPPDPTPDPIPGQKWQVVIINESSYIDNLPRGQQNILNSVRFRERLIEKGHKLVLGGVVDQDTKYDPGGVLAPFFVAGKSMLVPRKDELKPIILISALSGGKIYVFPLPKDEAGVFKLLEKGM